MSYEQDTRHKTFLSYCHQDDQHYKDRFEKMFVKLFINKSVKPGDINTDVSTDYIKRLIQKEHISDTSVLIVLVGRNSWSRKHIDWEISAALNKKVGGYSGLVAIRLPTHPDYGKNSCQLATLPPRLADNIRSGYAKLYDWTENENYIKSWVEDAFQARIKLANRIVNTRPQFGKNRDVKNLPIILAKEQILPHERNRIPHHKYRLGPKTKLPKRTIPPIMSGVVSIRWSKTH